MSAGRISVGRRAVLISMLASGAASSDAAQSAAGRIAFASSRDGNNEIYVMNADGTGVTRLTTTTTYRGSSEPAWCGDRIAFTSDRYIEYFPDVYVMNDDGTGVTRLTISNADFDTSPTWSPDCRQIAFVKDPSGVHSIYVMNADGTGVSGRTSGYDDAPAWSPDGTHIAFQSNRGAAPGWNHIFDIYVMNSNGSGVTRLTTTTTGTGTRAPAWSPDGRRIAFTRDGTMEVMNADGSEAGPVAASADQAAWFESSAWPNQPPDFRALNDQPWDSLIGSGWSWLLRGGSTDPDISADPAAPLSPQNVLRMTFTPDMSPGTEPSVHWIALPGSNELYTAWWIKLSPDWVPSPSSAGSMTSLFTGASGQVRTGLYHTCVWPEACDPELFGPPYKVAVSTAWAPYDGQTWYPNVTTTWINPGEWHRVEVYYRWETSPGASGDGVIRWWIDGVLNGDYGTVQYPSDSFIEFQFAPTLSEPPPAQQYMYVDHAYVSTP